MMSFRNITWQQTAILIACLIATICAYKFLGADAAGVSTIVSTVLAFLLGREPPPPPPPSPAGPSLKVFTGGLAAAIGVLLFSCGPVLGVAEYAEITKHTRDVNACFEEAQDAGKSLRQYEACKEDAGIK
jgi:hypothetical protein